MVAEDHHTLQRQNMTLDQAELGRIDAVSISNYAGLRRGLRFFIPVKDLPRHSLSFIESGNR
jgi:hypothetical protein